MVKEKRGNSFHTRPSKFEEKRKISLARQIHLVKIISPDDQEIKLTETMKKECENKTIYFTSKVHIVEDFKADEIRSLHSAEKTRNSPSLIRNKRTISSCQNVKVSILELNSVHVTFKF